MTTKPINEAVLFDQNWLNRILIHMKVNLSFYWTVSFVSFNNQRCLL